MLTVTATSAAAVHQAPTPVWLVPTSKQGVKVRVVVQAAELKQAAVHPVPDPDEKHAGVGAEGHAGYLAKEVQLLPSVVVALHVVDVDKVGWFRHRHELPIRGEADRPDGS